MNKNPMTKQERQKKYIQDKIDKGLCIQCGEKAVTARHCAFHRDQGYKYIKKWKSNNPEKFKEYLHTSYLRHREERLKKMQTYSREHYQKNKELYMEKQRAYRKRKKLAQS
ncbi:MAG: hypothetical protein UX04_C0002G0199 [Microgenomates group bacterium GW2011_GWF2_45_18]|nr:MAG: hypothetical protein UW18_C0003G0362 [Microgenomates group bacterium GW2011_GWF1_44_10]KKU02056.1 MAG: hypothetical protein UX04_C0002G0199 [Microgenomates group bacterium GW2011_GWF2_45_18]